MEMDDLELAEVWKFKYRYPHRIIYTLQFTVEYLHVQVQFCSIVQQFNLYYAEHLFLQVLA
jgi:hypothetical protein